ALHFAVGHRLWQLGVAAADEIADPGRLAEQVQDVFVEVDFAEQVARELLDLLDPPLAVADFRDLLHRNDNPANVRLEVFELYAPLQGRLDGVLAAALDFDHVPLFRVAGVGDGGGRLGGGYRGRGVRLARRGRRLGVWSNRGRFFVAHISAPIRAVGLP